TPKSFVTRSRYLSNSTADIHRNGSPGVDKPMPSVPALPRVLRGSSERHMRSCAQKISPCVTKALVIHPLVRIFLDLATLLALESLWSLVDGRRFLRLVRRSLGQPPGSYQPPAAVIVPCKGLDAGFDLNVSAFLTQRYPDYQLIFVVASEEDPAYRYLEERLKARSARGPALKTALLVAGRSETRGEKVNNLLAG